MFEADADQQRVVFTWSPPPVTQRNGIITNYTLSCSPSPSSLPLSTSSQSESLTVTEFSPNTLYSCSVVATNSQGSGPSSTISFTTMDCKTTVLLESYSFFSVHRFIFSVASSWSSIRSSNWRGSGWWSPHNNHCSHNHHCLYCEALSSQTVCRCFYCKALSSQTVCRC